MPHGTEAIIFDLYGTLARIRRPRMRRALARKLGLSSRDWMRLVRDDLLVRPYESDEALIDRILGEVGQDVSTTLRAQAQDMLREELESVEPLPEVQALLAFLKRRGYRLGLLSNLTSAHKRVLEGFSLYENFAAAGFSCDEGMSKPQPELYLRLCERLEASPDRTLFVGDSYQNDVKAPAQLGMRTMFLSSREEGFSSASLLGWIHLETTPELVSMLSEGSRIEWRHSAGVVTSFRPLQDDEQGRYNLVAEARLRVEGKAREETVFCKRFYFPEAGQVEAFAHQMMQEIGLSDCVTTLIEAPEEHLVVSQAPGRKFAHVVDNSLATEIGRHCAAAFILANADLRPRNAFVDDSIVPPRMTMVDLEHCFFALALDISGVERPLDPYSFDDMDPDELAGRIKKRVLTDRTTRRAMRSFVELESFETELAGAFRTGWVDCFRQIRERWPRLERLLEERVHRKPYLIIGTQAYRRAMAQVDIEEMKARVMLDAEEIFPRMAALTR